ncbi:hypothetical protein O181_000160 [Austropuccinia psidii MF-1]|uniref:Uncharacterized protein n=1 Tax=Austropuccinia psidii MF-1 TaxID=1389203 RepID=A0A9Q3B8C2_9BASI|nr:hypothetical protein [Austropuccinia psidii MF-1]
MERETNSEIMSISKTQSHIQDKLHSSYHKTSSTKPLESSHSQSLSQLRRSSRTSSQGATDELLQEASGIGKGKTNQSKISFTIPQYIANSIRHKTSVYIHELFY